MKIISQAEDAVFEAQTLKKDGSVNGNSCGFFISSQGLGITTGNIFMEADSGYIKTRNGNKYPIERIVSAHPYSNLAIVKIKAPRNKKFDYLMPAAKSFAEGQELMAFTHSDDAGKGTNILSINGIRYYPVVSRSGICNSALTTNSNGSALIDYDGKLSGILSSINDQPQKVVFNSYLLDDKNWKTIDLRVGELIANRSQMNLLDANLCYGIHFSILEDYIEAARKFGCHLELFNKDGIAYSMRGWARYKYNNTGGSKADFFEADRKSTNGYLHLYLQALIELDKQGNGNEDYYLNKCLSANPKFSQAIVEATLKKIKKRSITFDKAINDLTDAIESDSLNAKAYLERGKLLHRRFPNNNVALEDLDKAIFLDPDLPGSYSIRGTICFADRDFTTAVNDFNKAVLKNPKDTQALFYRGNAFYSLGLKKRACSDWQKAGELGFLEAYNSYTTYCK